MTAIGHGPPRARRAVVNDQVRLNDHVTASYTNGDPNRGVSPDIDPASGFIGLQQHTGAVSFRAIRIKPGPVGP